MMSSENFRMKIVIGTIFPDFFDGPLRVGNIGRAIEAGKLLIEVENLRDYTTDRHRKVDDRPFGGGPGMVMKAEPFFNLCFKKTGADTVDECRRRARIIIFTPRGQVLNQRTVIELAQADNLILLCGRYEGIDNRVAEHLATDEISIGDYILSGGEAAALVLIDAVVRLIPGVVGEKESLSEESFKDNLLEYPQYTRPEEFLGYRVPDELVSGNHRLIESWRIRRRIIDTYRRRPDLLEKARRNPELNRLIDTVLTKYINKEK